MPFSLEFQTAKIACLTSDGDVSLEDVVAAARALYADARFNPPTRILWDLRPGRGALGQPDVAGLIDFFIANRPDGLGRSAILVADDLSFGLSRMFEQLAAGDLPVEISVFRDPDKALAWLNEPVDSWGD